MGRALHEGLGAKEVRAAEAEGSVRMRGWGWGGGHAAAAGGPEGAWRGVGMVPKEVVGA